MLRRYGSLIAGYLLLRSAVLEHAASEWRTFMNKYLVYLAAAVVATAPGVGAEPVDTSKLTGLKLGQHVFLTYCAGCHGFDGLAFFPSAPSFAMGDRLMKSDAELMKSILKGTNAMPSWEDKLSLEWLEEALRYVRHVANLSKNGRLGATTQLPDYYYIFAPLGTDPNVMDWEIAIP